MNLKTQVDFVFDVDGTLTPSRQKIDEKFRLFFCDFIKQYHCTLLTGSDYPKTLEQLGSQIVEGVDNVYNCNGNIKTSNGYVIYERRWEVPDELLEYLQSTLDVTAWQEKYDVHLEDRGPMINFSLIGRTCTAEARERYFAWDSISREREKICNYINTTFPEVEAHIGGQISIDIGPKGSSKDQVLKYFKKSIYYFGDKVFPGGNDFPIAQRIETERLGRVFRVEDYKETWEILKAIYERQDTPDN